MEQIPDAPWIRDAELNGVPDDDPVKCPICGEECDTIFEDRYGNLFGCDQCIRKRDAWEYQEEWRKEQEDWRDDW